MILVDETGQSLIENALSSSLRNSRRYVFDWKKSIHTPAENVSLAGQYKPDQHVRAILPIMFDISHTFPRSPRATSCAMSLASNLAYYPLPPDDGFSPTSSQLPLKPVSGWTTWAGIGALFANLLTLPYEIATPWNSRPAGSLAEIRNRDDPRDIIDSTPNGELSLLYRNPPYDAEVSSFDNKRMELLFLRRTPSLAVNGGILVVVRVNVSRRVPWTNASSTC